MIRYWLIVVHHDHVQRGVELGIAQANHGAKGPLERMGTSDGIVYYSPRDTTDGAVLRSFTAIGHIADAAPRQDSDGTFRPWRRSVEYDTDVILASIRPLVGSLEFTRDKANWGYQLRRGCIEITKHDFRLIRLQMRRVVE